MVEVLINEMSVAVYFSDTKTTAPDRCALGSFVTIIRAANAMQHHGTSVSFLFASPCIMKPAHCEGNIDKRTENTHSKPVFYKKK